MPDPRYVERKNGKIVAHYSHPNEHATECVAADHSDLVEYAVERQRAFDADRDRFNLAKLEARIAKLEEQLATILKPGGW